jgi:hypothetical protein
MHPLPHKLLIPISLISCAHAGITSHFSFDGHATNTIPSQADGTEYGSVEYVTGKFGQAASLDSATDTINLNTSTAGAIGTGDFTISMWVNADAVTSVSSDPAFFSTKPWAGNHTAHNGFVYAIKSGNTLDISTITTTGGVDRNDWDNGAGGGGTPSLASGWNNLIIVRSGTSLSFYLNGSQFGSSYTLTANADFASSFQNFMVGDSTNASGGSPAEGDYNSGANWNNEILVDEIAIYDEAIDAAEITRLQTEFALTPPPTPAANQTTLSSGDHAKANENFLTDWGSNVDSDGNGGDADGRAIITGTGTPNIALEWGGSDSTNWQFWDANSGTNWSNNEAIQLDNMALNDTRTVTFTPASNALVGIKSFRWIGWENNMGQTVNVTVTGTSGTLYNTDFTLADSEDTRVTVDAIGNIGEALTLTFTRTNSAGNNNNIAITDLTFSEDFFVEPALTTTSHTPSDSAQSDRYGDALAIHRASARSLVGAPSDGDEAAGKAYLINLDTGAEIRQLTAADSTIGQRFGHALALNANYAVVSAPSDSNDKGAVYVFNPKTGAQLYKLTGDDSQAGDQFGWSIALENNLLAVGAPGNDENGIDAGAIYLFNLQSSGQVYKALPPANSAEDWFGFSLAMHSAKIIVGAPNDDQAGDDAGAIYVLDAASGSELQKITNSDPQDDAWFGYTVAATSDTIAAGAPLHTESTGATYLFNASTYAEFIKMTAEGDAAVNDQFGFDLDLSSSHLLVGTAANSNTEGVKAGAAYLYQLSDNSLVEKVLHTDQADEDFMGSALALSEDALLMGAPSHEDAAKYSSGNIYLSFILPVVKDEAYSDWTTSHQLSGNDSLETADPNQDGVDNLTSYAFDINPNSAANPSDWNTPSPLPLPEAENSSFTATFNLPAASRPDISYIVEQSTLLTSNSWTEISRKDGNSAWTGSASVSTQDNLDGTSSITVASTLVPNSDDKAFLRVRIVTLP